MQYYTRCQRNYPIEAKVVKNISSLSESIKEKRHVRRYEDRGNMHEAQGTHSRIKPPTSCRQVTQLPKLFIARLTRHSSQMHRQRQGQVIMERGFVWHTTHGGPFGPRPVAPDSHVLGSELEDISERRARIKRSSISVSSSADGFRVSLLDCVAVA